MTTTLRLVGVAWAVGMAVALSGCTLIHDDVPFRISVINQQTEPWDGTVRVLDAEGQERFQRHLTVAEHGMSLTLDVQPLVGDFAFIVESGGDRWEELATSQEGNYSWTVTVDASGTLCYQFLLPDDSKTTCPTPTRS